MHALAIRSFLRINACSCNSLFFLFFCAAMHALREVDSIRSFLRTKAVYRTRAANKQL